MLIRAGDVVYVGPTASVQFSDKSAITLRVIHVHDWPTYQGWCWLDGYQLDNNGDAVERREIFVRLAGLIPVGPPPLPGGPKKSVVTPTSPHRQARLPAPR